MTDSVTVRTDCMHKSLPNNSRPLPLPRLQSEAVRRKFVGPDGQPTAFAYQVAADIGQGVAALHARGIVHRDLKPQNVLLTESGRCGGRLLWRRCLAGI